jgi:hypothetical protein
MKIVFLDNSGIHRVSLYRLLFRALYGGYIPIVISGDRSFDLYHFLRTRKFLRVPAALLSKILFANPVNGHHLKTLIKRISSMDPNVYFTIFMDFSKHYLDDTVPEDIRSFMFRRDFQSISLLESSLRPVFFFESGRVYLGTKHQEFRDYILKNSNLIFKEENQKFHLKYFYAKQLEKEEFFYGSHSSGLFYLCRKIAERIQYISKISEKRRPDLLRQAI